VNGYNNWHRIALLRQKWAAERPGQAFRLAAAAPNPELYQDCFILACEGPYSGVAAESVELRQEDWLELSFQIRIAHECAHYWTRRVLKSMRNNIMDELIADYCGMLESIHHFREDWLCLFLGVEDFPHYRASGRLSYYRGDPPLSDEAFRILQELLVKAAANLNVFDRQHSGILHSDAGPIMILMTLPRLTLEELAAEDGSERLSATLATAQRASALAIADRQS
jgi:hypothetical protein